jgi:hypothetical protein
LFWAKIALRWAEIDDAMLGWPIMLGPFHKNQPFELQNGNQQDCKIVV